MPVLDRITTEGTSQVVRSTLLKKNWSWGGLLAFEGRVGEGTVWAEVGYRSTGGQELCGKDHKGDHIWGGVILVEDLRVKRDNRHNKRVSCQCITLAKQDFLLQLCADDPIMGDNLYVATIYQQSGVLISSSFVSLFFKNVGPFSGAFKNCQPYQSTNTTR